MGSNAGSGDGMGINTEVDTTASTAHSRCSVNVCCFPSVRLSLPLPGATFLSSVPLHSSSAWEAALDWQAVPRGDQESASALSLRVLF